MKKKKKLSLNIGGVDIKSGDKVEFDGKLYTVKFFIPRSKRTKKAKKKTKKKAKKS